MRDNRNTVIIAILILCIIIMMLTIVASASFELGLSARSAALYEPITKTFIYEKNADLQLPMASTTKIMTALLVIESCDLGEMVEIPREAVGIEGSSVYLCEGDVVSVKDLLYSLLLQSANDAAAALAMKVSGDIAQFAALMNERAASLGLNNTHFDNPHGLDSKEHYTTAKDLAVISATALSNPTFKQIVSTYKHSFTISDKQRTVVNHNKLLRSYNGAIGVKTGYTKKSGRCLVSAAERDDLVLIAVTLDAPSDWNDHASMLNYGFDRYEANNLNDLTTTKFDIPIMDASQDHIKAAVERSEDINFIKLKSDPSFYTRIDIKQYTVAPVKRGEKLGEIVVMQEGKEIVRLDIISTESVPRKQKRNKLFDIFNSREKNSAKNKASKIHS